MKKKCYPHRRRPWPWLLAIAIAAWTVYRQWPATNDDLRHAAVSLQGRMELCYVVKGDTLMVDTYAVAQQGVWKERMRLWPGCGGRIATTQTSDLSLSFGNNRLPDDNQAFIAQWSKRLEEQVAQMAHEKKELDYYLSCHGVVDEGYTRIADHAQLQRQRLDSLQAVSKHCKALDKKSSGRWICRYRLSATWWQGDSIVSAPCRVYIADATTSPKAMTIRTAEGEKPHGAYSVRPALWGSRGALVKTIVVAPATTARKRHAIVANSAVEKDSLLAPTLLRPEGAGVWSQGGALLGIVANGKIVGIY